MGIKIKSVEIVLDSPSNVFIPDQIICGQCLISMKGQMSSSQLFIKLKGKAECKWDAADGTETYRDDDGNYRTRTKYRTVYERDYPVNLVQLNTCMNYVLEFNMIT